MCAQTIKELYDYVVLGDAPGALIGGCLAAQRGKSVLVLPVESKWKAGVFFSREYLTFESNFFLGSVGDCLGEIGILPAERSSIKSEDVYLQVLTPSQRVSFTADTTSFEAELKREFSKYPDLKDGLITALNSSEFAIIDFWKQIVSKLETAKQKEWPSFLNTTLDQLRTQLLFENQRRGRKTAKAFFAPKNNIHKNTFSGLSAVDIPGWNELCAGVWFGLTSSYCQFPSPFELIHLMTLAKTSAYFRGGLMCYRDLLRRLLQRLGAQIISRSHCSSVYLSDNRPSSVQISKMGGVVGVNRILLGISLDRITSLFARGHPSANIIPDGMASSKKPWGWKMSFVVHLHAHGILPGMSRRVVWYEENSPPLEIEMVKTSEYHLSQHHRVLFYVRSIIPYLPENLAPSFLQVFAQRMLNKFFEILPFSERHVLRIFPDFRNENHLPEIYPFGKLSEIPEVLLCFEHDGVGFQSGIKDLYNASYESYPQLGSLGGYFSALQTVIWGGENAS